MTSYFRLSASVATLAILSGSPVFAQVSALDVWDGWQTSLEMYSSDGVSVGSEETAEGELTVNDLVLTFEDDVTTITMTMDTLRFVENGDGTVNVIMPDSYPVVITGETDGTLTFSINQVDANLVFSGEPGALSYEIDAAQYSLQLESIDGVEGPVEGDMLFNFNNVTGNSSSTNTDMTDIVYNLAVGSIDFLIDFVAPDDSVGQFIASGQIDGMDLTSDVSLPSDVNFDEPETLFAEGFSVDIGYTLGAAAYLFDITDAEGQNTGTATVGATSFTGVADATRFAYDAVVSDMAIDVNAAGMPFPVSVSMGQYAVGLEMPVSASDTPSPFRLLVNLEDLSVNDEIWAMVDPSNQLSHDPATLRIALSGEATLDYNLFDTAQMEALGDDEAPGSLQALSLDDLTLVMSGAELTGTGAFTFDNTDTTTFDGFPRPTGEATFNLTGGNALLDDLVSLGVLPPEQAMMARMGIGMFARSVGDDELTSTIEVNEAGEVRANGQRLR